MSLSDKLRKATQQSQPVEWERQVNLLCSPNVPAPMHGLAPRIIKGRQWWDKIRKEAYKRTDFHCVACGIARYEKHCSQLEGHEVYEIDYLLGRMTYLRTEPLCPWCHSFIHAGLTMHLMTSGQISRQIYRLIEAHGTKLLSDAGITLPLPYRGSQAEWQDWRLLFEGTEYLPRHPSEEGWERAYGN